MKTKNLSIIVKKIAEKALVRNANSTTSMIYYQPKAPKELRKFSNIENDK